MNVIMGVAITVIGALFLALVGWIVVCVRGAGRGMADNGPEGCDGEGADTR
jgi:hypothetical protein